VVVRARYLLAATSAAVVLRLVVACSTSAKPAAAVPEAGPPGEAFTACEIQGYVSESEGGLCPDGTCPALAFDTNGARVPCCTSIVTGPAMCVDAGAAEPLDATEAEAEPADDGADAPVADSGAEAGAEGSAEAGGDSAASEAGPSQDAADGE
jgi:hypothetical protein